MTDEDGFQAAIDAAPDDALLRQVYADWLEERGDPRGPGYRAAAACGLNPCDAQLRPCGAKTLLAYGPPALGEFGRYCVRKLWLLHARATWFRLGRFDAPLMGVPDPWFRRLDRFDPAGDGWCDYPTRRGTAGATTRPGGRPTTPWRWPSPA